MTITIDRSTCAARRHGRYWTYDKHGCRCPDAIRDAAQRRSRQRAGTLPPGYVDATGARRRLQALCVEGWTVVEVAAQSGLTVRTLRYVLNTRRRINATTARCIAVTYDRLAGGIGDNKATTTRALQRGWVGSDRWTPETIDNPAAKPLPTGQARVVVDLVLVDRVLAGRDRVEVLNNAERMEAARIGLSRGMPKKHLVTLLRIRHTTLTRLAA